MNHSRFYPILLIRGLLDRAMDAMVTNDISNLGSSMEVITRRGGRWWGLFLPRPLIESKCFVIRRCFEERRGSAPRGDRAEEKSNRARKIGDELEARPEQIQADVPARLGVSQVVHSD